MSAPEPTAVERTIAEVDCAHQFGEWREASPGRYQRACTCGHLLDCTDEGHLYADMHSHRAQAVVAAIRAMTPSERHALIGEALSEDECRITVSAFGLTDAEADAMFDRVADAAHELDEQVMCSSVGPTKVRRDV